MRDKLLFERIDSVRSRLISNSAIQSFDVLNEQVIEGIGLYRIRARLTNGDFVQFLERFELVDGKIHISKYSFHWQNTNGSLIRRWDNAPHHREIATFPHHLHEDDENNVLPHEAMDCFTVLRMIEDKLTRGKRGN